MKLTPQERRGAELILVEVVRKLRAMHMGVSAETVADHCRRLIDQGRADGEADVFPAAARLPEAHELKTVLARAEDLA